MNPTSQEQPPKSNPKIDSPTLPQKKVVYKPFDQKLTFICKFCGGKTCKHEDYLTYPQSAIKGLNSDWVTSDILATQRPSSRIIKEFNITQAFLDHGINAIFNLQEPGEHPFCGDGIHPQSGFSYFPEEFYEHGIYFFNFGWKDMTATGTDVILKILKQMSFSLMNGNKIAIHCHAGRGRTGLIIAAWLIYHHNMTAKEAIKLVRSKRKGAIQSKSQAEILYQLDKEIRESRIIYHHGPKFKLEDYLFHQKKLLPLSTESEVRFIPNIMLVALDRLETLATSKFCKPQDICLAFYSPNDSLYYKGEWAVYHDKALKSFKEKINSGSYEFSDIDDPRILAQGILDFFDNFSVPAIKNQFIDTLHSQIHGREKFRNIKNHFFKQLDKKEFMIIERFVKFFAVLIEEDEELPIQHIIKAALRICVSLLLERKRFDKIFLKRSLIKDHSGEDRITYLHMFMLKWIENFSEQFTENFMMVNSPLHINEKRVSCKLERVDSKRGTYLNRALGSETDNTSKDSRDLLQAEDEIKMKSSPDSANSTNKIESSFRQQALQEGKIRDARTSILPFEANSGTNSNSIKSDQPVLKLNQVQSGENTPGGGTSNSLSPAKMKGKNFVQMRRISLMSSDSPFAKQESDGSGANIQKNYDEFFSQNNFIVEETQGDQKMTEPDSNTKEIKKIEMSENERLHQILGAIDHLSDEKREFILEKLLKARGENMIKVEG